MKNFLLLITASPHHPNAKKALAFAKEELQKNNKVQVFFYGDGAYTANGFMWQSADVPNIADGWAALHEQFGLALPVCVSTALARGVVDKTNAQAHHLSGANLRAPFYLVGLSHFALALENSHLVQF